MTPVTPTPGLWGLGGAGGVMPGGPLLQDNQSTTNGGHPATKPPFPSCRMGWNFSKGKPFD